MSNEYPLVQLADIASDVSYGYTASSSQQPIGPKFLRITDIAKECLNWDGVPYCSISDSDATRYRLNRGDIVIARTGATVGHSKVIGDAPEAVYASYLIRVRVMPEHDPVYVGYVIGSSDYKRWVLANAGGAAQPNANAKVLTSYQLPLPSLPTQRKIAAILSAYDDLIENNIQRIKIMEEMARRIYREWFVDFMYPGHEGVRLVDSELGPIPEGWEIRSLDEVCSRITDGAHASPATTDAGMPMASVKDMTNFGLDIAGSRRISEKDYKDLCKWDCKPMDGDVLISKDGAKYLDKVFVMHNDQDVVLLSSIAILRPSELIQPSFLAATLADPQAKQRLKGHVSGAAIPRVVVKDFKMFRILVPPGDLQRRFDGLGGAMRLTAAAFERTNWSLQINRDLLLPRLISGEIDVDDLNIAVPDAA